MPKEKRKDREEKHRKKDRKEKQKNNSDLSFAQIDFNEPLHFNENKNMIEKEMSYWKSEQSCLSTTVQNEYTENKQTPIVEKSTKTLTYNSYDNAISFNEGIFFLYLKNVFIMF